LVAVELAATQGMVVTVTYLRAVTVVGVPVAAALELFPRIVQTFTQLAAEGLAFLGKEPAVLVERRVTQTLVLIQLGVKAVQAVLPLRMLPTEIEMELHTAVAADQLAVQVAVQVLVALSELFGALTVHSLLLIQVIYDPAIPRWICH
jgi:hypothetical protein